MKWSDLIEQVLIKNNGIVSLQELYRNAKKFRELPSGDWQKTLRGVLYRDINRGRFKKVGLGVYALPNYYNETSAYSQALKDKNAESYLKTVKDPHSEIEGMLIELGNYFDYITYSSDLGKTFDGKKLGYLCQITTIPEFTYPELKYTIAKSDIVWFNKSRLLFPKVVFEVESTTDFTNSMLKMYQLVNFDTRFVLVASYSREGIFLNRLDKEPFCSAKSKFSFRSFEAVTELYFSSVKHYELKTGFLNFEERKL